MLTVRIAAKLPKQLLVPFDAASTVLCDLKSGRIVVLRTDATVPDR